MKSVIEMIVGILMLALGSMALGPLYIMVKRQTVIKVYEGLKHQSNLGSFTRKLTGKQFKY